MLLISARVAPGNGLFLLPSRLLLRKGLCHLDRWQYLRPTPSRWPICCTGLAAGSSPADVTGRGKNLALGFFAGFSFSEESDRCY